MTSLCLLQASQATRCLPCLRWSQANIHIHSQVLLYVNMASDMCMCGLVTDCCCCCCRCRCRCFAYSVCSRCWQFFISLLRSSMCAEVSAVIKNYPYKSQKERTRITMPHTLGPQLHKERIHSSASIAPTRKQTCVKCILIVRSAWFPSRIIQTYTYIECEQANVPNKIRTLNDHHRCAHVVVLSVN